MEFVNDSLPDLSDFQLQTHIHRDLGESSPPVIEVGLKSNASKSALFGPYPPLDTHQAVQEQGENKLLILPVNPEIQHYYPEDDDVDQFIPNSPQNSCWTAKSDVGTVNQPGVVVEFEEGEVYSRKYNILNHPDNSGCFPSGDYRIKTNLTTNEQEKHWTMSIRI